MASSSNEFAELVSKLHQSPSDPSIKNAVQEHLSKMKYLAQKSPLALYHLAQIYAPNSPHYQQTMRQAANLGCTNAMLAMCELLGKSNNPSEVRKAAHYLLTINKSGDSYIKEQAQKLLNEYPQLAKMAKEQSKTNLSTIHSHRFFTLKQEPEIEANYCDAVACKA